MGLLVDYGSDSDSEQEAAPVAVVKPSQASSSQPKKPAPKKKIGIALPALSKRNDDEDAPEDSIDDRPAKKPRLGSGKSSLLGMLPAPKSNKPIAVPQQRILGGGSGPGLVFSSSRPTDDIPSQEASEAPSNPYAATMSEEVDEDAPKPSTSSKPFNLLPPSLQKKRANVSLEETSANTPRPIQPPTKPAVPTVDFFGLSGATSSAHKFPQLSLSKPSTPSLSSAPALPDFEVPEPTPYDPYPGYYQLPSGQWAQHDAEYYAKFTKKWKHDYDAHVRALEKGTVKGFEGYDASNAQQIDPVEEMERAKKEVKEREEYKALTAGAGAGPSEPKMKISAAKMSGVARSRHQLSTLLKEAYENREALEERIAQGKRNRKEAGNKYGF
ncbi:hypothetical protein D9611_004727 [Ephemerocybe angulata]|uniref:Mitotic checkpoint regulator, MAD2B-interacting-domain-containing protein n=1 Tax=Ephemerocybe angulata TaxID=980116 RepID=A0A8H5EXD4_9AGAR|nr:hypothetical protein D9611_004727 [Tulosesus angulatus]